ncbi:MAG TPA: serine hydrolase [Gemmatimonadales bacterium]|nr:serine hydrolase [Gemmatimonadales bacterium]
MHFIAAVALLASLQQSLPSDSAVRALLAPRVQAFADSGKHGEGIVVGLIDAGGRRRIVALGVDSNAVFEIGSITKTFTASILADMVSRGEVRLDDPVETYLPPGDSVRIPSRNGKKITLVDLATQSSGLPRLPSNMAPRDSSNPYADYSVQQLYAFLSGYTLPRDIGSTYEYSNLGMGLLGHALARKAGMSYETLVTRRVLAPLGMNETAISLTPALRSRLAPGHDVDGNVVPNWDLPTLAGAGALRSTTRDMLTYLAANLDTTTALERAMRDAHTPRREAGSPNMRIGLAWHILSRPGGSIVWHNGGTGGYRTFTGFDPARRIGVVVLSNVNSSVDDLGFHLLDETVPLLPPPVRRTEVALDSLVLARYVGEYELAPTFHITVTRQGAHLFLQATAQPKFPIFAESDSTFFLKVVDAQLTFRRDGLVLHQNGQHIPGRKLQ